MYLTSWEDIFIPNNLLWSCVTIWVYEIFDLNSKIIRNAWNIISLSSLGHFHWYKLYMHVFFCQNLIYWSIWRNTTPNQSKTSIASDFDQVHFDEMMIMSALYLTNMSFDHQNNSPYVDRHRHIILILSRPIFALNP